MVYVTQLGSIGDSPQVLINLHGQNPVIGCVLDNGSVEKFWTQKSSHRLLVLSCFVVVIFLMFVFPHLPRSKKRQQQFRPMWNTRGQSVLGAFSFQTGKLVEVTSNIWGTKFKLHGVASFLPEDVGHVLYKTSLLHLQPRQVLEHA